MIELDGFDELFGSDSPVEEFSKAPPADTIGSKATAAGAVRLLRFATPPVVRVALRLRTGFAGAFAAEVLGAGSFPGALSRDEVGAGARAGGFLRDFLLRVNVLVFLRLLMTTGVPRAGTPESIKVVLSGTDLEGICARFGAATGRSSTWGP